MNITEKELSFINELCSLEELAYKKYQLLISLYHDDDEDIKNMLSTEANRHKNNIKRLISYL